MDLRYERVLHRIAALIGGFAGAYTVLIRLNLGSSQTMNLLELLTGLLGKDYLQAALEDRQLQPVLRALNGAGNLFSVS